MDEIVRRLRARSTESMLSLKESMPIHGIKEADEDEEINDISTEETPVDTATDDEELDIPTPIKKREEEDTPDTEEKSPSDLDNPGGEEGDHINPLDNHYAVKYTIGQGVALIYSNGSKSKLAGTIDGYDKEGFYRIRWSNGRTTSGLTDLALADLVDEVEESKCVCGSTNFVNENNQVVCDRCGRLMNRGVKIRESNAYSIRYEYDGDSLSDYQSNVLVVADSPEEAIKLARKKLPDGRFFQIESKYDSVDAFKSKYPKSNYKVIEEFTDPLTLADRKRSQGKKMIRSEAHPMSTTSNSGIGESIRKAFSKKKLTEDWDDEEYEEDPIKNFRDRFEGEFWTVHSEMIEDIENAGYEVVTDNDEYITVALTDAEGDEGELQIFIGGTSRTMTLDFRRSRFMVGM